MHKLLRTNFRTMSLLMKSRHNNDAARCFSCHQTNFSKTVPGQWRV